MHLVEFGYTETPQNLQYTLWATSLETSQNICKSSKQPTSLQKENYAAIEELLWGA